MRDGYGIQFYKNGEKYQGYWKDNLYEGYGIKIFENGDIYDGE